MIVYNIGIICANECKRYRDHLFGPVLKLLASSSRSPQHLRPWSPNRSACFQPEAGTNVCGALATKAMTCYEQLAFSWYFPSSSLSLHPLRAPRSPFRLDKKEQRANKRRLQVLGSGCGWAHKPDAWLGRGTFDFFSS